jgi:putative transposase
MDYYMSRFSVGHYRLGHHLFDSLTQLQDFATRWLWLYNHERPNMGLGGITPKQKLALAA